MSNAADTDGWEVVGKSQHHKAGPRLTIYSNGNGYVNAAADERFLDGADACRVLVDHANERLALDPVDADHPDGYSVTRDDDGYGGDVRVIGALERLGLDVDDLEDTHFLSLEPDGDLVVADCNPLFAATHTGDRDLDATTTAADDADDPHDADDADEADEEFACNYDDCEFTSDSERGRNIHEARSHDDEDEDDQEEGTDEGSELTPDDVELPGSLTEGDVHAVADFLPTVEDVANDFEVPVDRAEKILRAYDCLEEVSQ